MEKKLKRLESELEAMISDNPTLGHGGTPFITDNSKGRAQIKRMNKYSDRIFSKMQEIEDHKEKIDRAETRRVLKSIPTKKSQKFIKDNPISDVLLDLQARGLVRQWKKNPQYFFVTGLDKVAIVTIGGVVQISEKYNVKSDEDRAVVEEMLK